MDSLFGVTMIDGDWKVYRFTDYRVAVRWLHLQPTPATYLVTKQTAEEIAGRTAVNKAVSRLI